MTRGGIPIEDYPVKHGVNPNISYAPAYAELEACIAAGLDPWRWETGGYPATFQARIVAWYQLRQLVELNVQDAVQRKANRKRR